MIQIDKATFKLLHLSASCQVFPIYLGCYKNFETVTEDPMAIQSAGSCVEACTGHVLHFVGIKVECLLV